jgi:hypothetical protein
MAIDTTLETLVTFADARTAFPGDRRLSNATLHRWRLHGVRGVRLETVLIGGLRYTSKEAIERFITAQNADETPARVPTPAQRRRQADAAQAALQEAGL